jgi:hypothetical protein
MRAVSHSIGCQSEASTKAAPRARKSEIHHRLF